MPAATPRLYFQTLFQHEVLRLYQHRTQAHFARDQCFFNFGQKGIK